MSKRINIILPDATLAVLDRVAPKGGRSRLIAHAVLHYVKTRSKANLAERLKQGALANAKLNLEIAEEWFPVDHEEWNRLDQLERATKDTRSGAKSTSRRSTRAIGHEIKKTRPAIVVQNNITNHYGLTIIVAAITSKVSPRPYPNEVIVHPGKSGLQVVSTIRLDQLRTVDRQRLIKRLGAADAQTMKDVDAAMRISLGLEQLLIPLSQR